LRRPALGGAFVRRLDVTFRALVVGEATHERSGRRVTVVGHVSLEIVVAVVVPDLDRLAPRIDAEEAVRGLRIRAQLDLPAASGIGRERPDLDATHYEIERRLACEPASYDTEPSLRCRRERKLRPTVCLGGMRGRPQLLRDVGAGHGVRGVYDRD